MIDKLSYQQTKIVKIFSLQTEAKNILLVILHKHLILTNLQIRQKYKSGTPISIKAHNSNFLSKRGVFFSHEG